MKTVVYVKTNATEQLLLKEGLFKQLEIVTYHPDVFTTTGRSTVRVSMISVHLLKPVKVPSRVSVCVQVQACRVNGPRMVEPDPSLQSKEGLHLSPILIDLINGVVSIVLSNHSGFTCPMEEGRELGTLERAEIVQQQPQNVVPESDDYIEVRRVRVHSPSCSEEHRQKLREVFLDDQDLPHEVRE